jgi:hypothetical protein
MLKFLRVYNKWILVVFGSFLMIAFLAPQGLQQLGGTPGSQTAFTVNGRKVSMLDEQRAASELRVLNNLGLMQGVAVFLGQQPTEPVNTLQWILLTGEAKDAGLIGGPEDGRAFLADFVERQLLQQMRAAPSPEQLQQTIQGVTDRGRSDTRMTSDEFHQALANLRGIERLVNLANGFVRVSEPRAISLATAAGHSVWIDAVAIPADRAIAAPPAPAEADIAKFYDEFKGVDQGKGTYGIGYTLPPRVKLEYLTLSKEAILPLIETDPVKVNQAWRQDRVKYPGEFAAERAKVETDLKQARADEVMSEASRVVQAEVLRGLRALESDGRYKKTPADWASTRPRWGPIAQAVADQVAASTGIKIPLPTVTEINDRWLTAQDLRTLEGIGASSLRLGSINTPFASLALAVRGLGQESTSPVAVQLLVPIAEGYLADAKGNRYYATVTDARKQSSPDSLAEIRETIVKDMQRRAAFDALSARAEEFKSLAASGGLAGVAALFPGPAPAAGQPPEPLKVIEQIEVSRDRVNSVKDFMAAFTLNSDELRKAVLAAAEPLDPTKPVSEQPATVVVVPVPSKLEVIVARLTALSPFTQDDFRQVSPSEFEGLGRRTVSESIGEEAQSPFSMRALLARHAVADADGKKVDLKSEAIQTP